MFDSLKRLCDAIATTAVSGSEALSDYVEYERATAKATRLYANWAAVEEAKASAFVSVARSQERIAKLDPKVIAKLSAQLKAITK